MLGIAIAGLLAASLGNSDPDAGPLEVSAVHQETQEPATESVAEATRAEGDAQDRSPQVKGLGLQPKRASQIKGLIFAGGGLWLSNCAYVPSSGVPALAVGLGLSARTGPHTELLLRGGVQLGLAGCGASTEPTGHASLFGTTYYERPSPPRGSSTFGVVLDALLRGRLGGSTSSLVIDFGPRVGMLGTAGTNGTNTMALFQLVFELGAGFGERNEWEILLQLPAGFVINSQLFGHASPDNDNGGVITPMLLLARSF